MAKEQTLIDKIKDFVKNKGGKVIKIHQSVYSEAGVPDLIVFLPSGTYMVETKKDGKIPTRLQQAKIDEINRAGGKAFWTDSIDDFIQQMSNL